jgi:hypothetical protein
MRRNAETRKRRMCRETALGRFRSVASSAAQLCCVMLRLYDHIGENYSRYRGPMRALRLWLMSAGRREVGLNVGAGRGLTNRVTETSLR